MRIERLPGFLQTYPQERTQIPHFIILSPPRSLWLATHPLLRLSLAPWQKLSAQVRPVLSKRDRTVCVQVILSGFRASATARCQLFPRTNLVRLGGAVDASKCEERSRVRSTRPALRRPRRNQFVPHSVRQLHAGASHTQPRQVAARTKCKNNGHCRGTVSLAPMQACAYRRYDQRRHCTGRNRIQERS